MVLRIFPLMLILSIKLNRIKFNNIFNIDKSHLHHYTEFNTAFENCANACIIKKKNDEK